MGLLRETNARQWLFQRIEAIAYMSARVEMSLASPIVLNLVTHKSINVNSVFTKLAVLNL